MNMQDRRSVSSDILVSRRGVLKMGMIALAAGLIPHDSLAALDDFLSEDRRICIFNLHTKEHLDVVYFSNGCYDTEALKRIDHIFRDHYTGLVKKIDTNLIDLLFAIHRKLGTHEPFHLISGYRSRRTNEMLRKRNRKVAKRSMHIYGKAADIRLPDHRLRDLRRVAYTLHRGGVGYYPRSKFVHIDVGKVRFWRG
jgi:uncharacterized protein YcbK (DUF882 family)